MDTKALENFIRRKQKREHQDAAMAHAGDCKFFYVDY